MKKNIMIVVSEFPPGPGGIGDHAYNLATKLSEKGYELWSQNLGPMLDSLINEKRLNVFD